MSIRFAGQDNLTASELMAMVGQALREGWDVPLAQKKRVVVMLERIALNLEGCYSLRQQFRAIRLLMAMEDSNRWAEIEAAKHTLAVERTNLIGRMESSRTASFAEMTPSID